MGQVKKINLTKSVTYNISGNNSCNVLYRMRCECGRGFQGGLCPLCVCVCVCVHDEVMTESAIQAPRQASSDQQRGEGDEDEEEECVYMFRYPRGSREVNRSVSHPESPTTFLTVALHVCVFVCVGQTEAMQPCECERPTAIKKGMISLYVVLCQTSPFC